MRVTIKAILTFRDILGSRQLDLNVPEGATVGDLLQELMRRYGEALVGLLWDAQAGRPARHVRLLVNGQDIAFLNDLSTVLHDGDDLTLFPPAAGG